MVHASAQATMANVTIISDLPPLPDYTVTPIPPLLPFISDFWLSLIAPHIAYWVVSMLFHVIDVYDLFPQYRLHTPDEIAQRKPASRFEVARDVLLEQVIRDRQFGRRPDSHRGDADDGNGAVRWLPSGRPEFASRSVPYPPSSGSWASTLRPSPRICLPRTRSSREPSRWPLTPS